MIEAGRLPIGGVTLHSTGQQLFDFGYALLAFFGGHADSFRVMTAESETLFVRDIGILYFPRAGGGQKAARRQVMAFSSAVASAEKRVPMPCDFRASQEPAHVQRIRA